MIVVSDKYGNRLCQDSKVRSFAPLGTFPSCVKLYRKLACAQKAAEKRDMCVVQLPDNNEMDANGCLYSIENGVRKTIGHLSALVS